jgi:outer membrane protein assembly factor BamB
MTKSKYRIRDEYRMMHAHNAFETYWIARRWRLAMLAGCLVGLLAANACIGAVSGADWPQFRGPGGRGVSQEKGLPTNIAQKEGIAWSVPLPGPGPASPIVVQGKVIVTAASGSHQERLHVLAFDATTGKPCWQRTVWATGVTLCNPFGGVAAPTPASDGKLVVALFSSNDLVCFDLDGNLKWLRGLTSESPGTRNDTGMASSPLVAGDTVVVQLGNPGTAFAAGLDIVTGQTRWRMPMESIGCWTTPVYLPGKTASLDRVVLQNRSRLVAIEPRTGKPAWTYEQGCSTLSSTTAAEGVLLTPAGGLMALQSESENEQPKLLWKQQRLQPENVSPVVCGDRLYVIKSGGVLVCGALTSGSVLWQLRLRGPIWATPVVADGHLYAINQDGVVQVVRLGSDSAEEVTSCELESGALATPAIADGGIYFRTKSRLWKIGQTSPSR